MQQSPADAHLLGLVGYHQGWKPFGASWTMRGPLVAPWFTSPISKEAPTPLCFSELQLGHASQHGYFNTGNAPVSLINYFLFSD